MRTYCKRFFQCAIMKALESEVITKSKYKRIAQSEQQKKKKKNYRGLCR